MTDSDTIPPNGESIVVSALIPASPEAIFDAWLDSAAHTAFTGSPASVEPVMYGKHTAWDGYIEGVTLEMDRGLRIVQTWRTSEFPAASPDSRLELRFAKKGGSTELTLIHTDIPPGQGSAYEKGWEEHYFQPMVAYFQKSGGKKTASKAAGQAKPKKAGKKAVAKGRTKIKAKVASKGKTKSKPKAKLKAKAKPKPKAKPKKKAAKKKR